MSARNGSITREQVLEALRAQLAKGACDADVLAETLGATGKAIRLHLIRLRDAGLVTYEPRDLSTVTLVGEKRARPAKAPAAKPARKRTIADVAEKHVEPTQAPAADRWTATEMRELLDVPRRAVTLVRRALAAPWGPALLDAIDSLVEETETVPVTRAVAPAAARTARAPRKPTVEPVEEKPPAKIGRAPFRVVDAGGDVVRTCKTLSAAKAALASDDADHVLDADDRIVARGGVDDEEE